MRSVLYAAIATELLAINAYVVPLVGAEHLARNDAPPRMIFVEDADAITMIEGPGGNPRGLFSVVEGSECVIFGESRDHVEGMRDQFLTALHKAVKKGNAGTARGGRYAVTKGGYKRSALIGRNGFEYRLGFGVLVAVVDRKWEAPAPGDPQQAPVASTYVPKTAPRSPSGLRRVKSISSVWLSTCRLYQSQPPTAATTKSPHW